MQLFNSIHFLRILFFIFYLNFPFFLVFHFLSFHSNRYLGWVLIYINSFFDVFSFCTRKLLIVSHITKIFSFMILCHHYHCLHYHHDCSCSFVLHCRRKKQEKCLFQQMTRKLYYNSIFIYLVKKTLLLKNIFHKSHKTQRQNIFSSNFYYET